MYGLPGILIHARGQLVVSVHCNIRSLSANFDNLQHMLSELYLPFSIVGLTEIKLNVDQSFLPNIEMPGYSFTFQPSL